MKKYLKLLLSFLLLIGFTGCSSIIQLQPPQTHREVLLSEFHRTFQPSELKEDIDFLFQTLESVHPNLYAYTPKSFIDKEREKIVNDITSPLSRIDFYVKIAPLVAKLNDGHTSVFPPYEEFRYYLNQKGLLFPLDLDFRDGKAFVVANYAQDSLIPVGSELLSLNKIPIDKMLDNLLQYISGEKASFKIENLENRFRNMLWFVYKFEHQYEVEFISQLTGEHCTRKIRGVNVETIRTKRKSASKNEKPVYYTYRSLPDEKICIIDFRSFSDLEQFKTFLKETFTRIQKDSIASLIIDIRENGGGNSILGDALLNYITDKPFVQASRMEVKVSKQIKNYYRSYLPRYIRWLPLQYFHPFGRKIWGTPEGGTAIFPSKPEIQKNNPLRFKGQIYLLIGPKTFSSAAMFAATVKDYKLGTLVGEETGGLATSYGDIYPFDLPNTRIMVGVSHKRFVRPSGEDDGKGVLPDYEVKEDVKDRVSGLDTVMEFTKELINSSCRKLKK